MKKSISLLLTLLFILISNQTLADRENEMWQQYKAKKGIEELDALFEEKTSRPEPKPEPVVVERVIVVPAPVAEAKPVAVVTPEPKPVPKPVPALKPETVTVEADGYVFNLGSCNLSRRNIKCQLTIESVSKDGELQMFGSSGYRSSKLFDRNGNEYSPTMITMGNKSSLNYVRNKYISGVRAKGFVEFENVNQNTQSISMFELSVQNVVTRRAKRIQFRDVALNM